MPDSKRPDKNDKPKRQERGPGDNRNNKNQPPVMGRGIWGWAILAGLLVALLLVVNQNKFQSKEITFDEFVNYARNDSFEGEITVKNTSIIGTLKKETPGLKENEPIRRYVTISPESKEFRLKTLENISAISDQIKEDPSESFLPQFIFIWGPFILIGVLIYFFFFRAMRGAGGGPGMLGSFGRSRHRVMNKEHSNVTLDDVAGINEAKEEVHEIIEFLKNPKKFQRLGGRVPRGVLLIGSPGCGKTLLAKAMAGEADVPFFSISGSDFVEMFVGVGASRVRDLFKQAKDSSPCVIFLDEIDAVGRKRGSGFTSGGHDEREQTLNAILVEMDGFDTSDQVIVIAATNRADVLDPALTRPGRFDRQIQVPLPDLRGRVEILKVHSKRIKMSPDIDLEKVARGTPMFSGADLSAVINEAAIMATMLEKDFVEQEDLEEARDKVRFGRSMRSRKIEEEERIATAYHEAGHAVIQKLMKNADPLHKVTIIPRGRAMGATMSLPEKDRYGYGRKYLHDTMRVLCGGRIAELKKTEDISSGAAMDIHMATESARHMILEWGMSDKLGFIDYTPNSGPDSFMPERAYSDGTAKIIDEEIKRLIDEAYADAQKIIDENWEKVVAIAEALLKHETLTAEEVDKLFKGEKLRKSSVSDLLEMEFDKPLSSTFPTFDDEDGLDDAPGAFPSPA